MTALFKLLFVAATAGCCVYAMSLYGAGLWSVAFLAIAVLVLASLRLPVLHATATAVARVAGVLAALGLALLLLAATTGGSFRLSPDSATIAVFLGLIAVFGLGAFGWKPGKPDTPDR